MSDTPVFDVPTTIVPKQFGIVVAASKFSVKSATGLQVVVKLNGPTQELKPLLVAPQSA